MVRGGTSTAKEVEMWRAANRLEAEELDSVTKVGGVLSQLWHWQYDGEKEPISTGARRQHDIG